MKKPRYIFRVVDRSGVFVLELILTTSEVGLIWDHAARKESIEHIRVTCLGETDAESQVDELDSILDANW